MATSSLVAWSPVQESNGPLLFSVRVPEGQPLELPVYLSYLASRLQSLINQSPSPQEATAHLSELLDEAGLQSPLSTSPQDAAQTLLLSNPAVRSRLFQHGLPLNQELKELRPVEMLSARQQLQADKENPLPRLESWVSAVSVLR